MKTVYELVFLRLATYPITWKRYALAHIYQRQAN